MTNRQRFLSYLRHYESKHLEQISDGEIAELNVPTGIPRVYRFDSSFQLAESPRYLGDAAAAEARAQAVARQAQAR